MSARAQIIFLSIFPILVGLMSFGGETHRRQFRYCALCRIVRCDYKSVAGYGWSEFGINECSEWYPKNIESTHEHVWQRSPSSAGFNRNGKPIWVADSDRPGGLLLLTPAEQVAIYEHITNAVEAKRLFVEMRSDAETENYDRHLVVRSKAHILKDWSNSNFKRSWGEILARLEETENLIVSSDRAN
jgi:hypothetical protein